MRKREHASGMVEFVPSREDVIQEETRDIYLDMVELAGEIHVLRSCAGLPKRHPYGIEERAERINKRLEKVAVGAVAAQKERTDGPRRPPGWGF